MVRGGARPGAGAPRKKHPKKTCAIVLSHDVIAALDKANLKRQEDEKVPSSVSAVADKALRKQMEEEGFLE